jgi:hypothetical protein
MAALGHDDLKQPRSAARSPTRETQARDAMDKVTALVQRRKKSG